LNFILGRIIPHAFFNLIFDHEYILPTQNIAPTLSLVFIQLQTRGSPLKPFSLHQPSNDDHRISNPSRKKSRAIIIFQTFTQSFPDRLYLSDQSWSTLSLVILLKYICLNRS